MAYSKKDSERLIKVPTLDDWIKAKERYHKRMTKLPFIKKIRIIDKMNEDGVIRLPESGKRE